MIDRKTNTQRQNITSMADVVIFVTGRMPQSGKPPVLNLLTGQKSGFSPPDLGIVNGIIAG